jgi:hypothetical protein
MATSIQSRTSSQTTDPFCQKPATSLLYASRKWTFRETSARNFDVLEGLAGVVPSVDVAKGSAGELSSVDVVEGLVGRLASAGGSDDGLSERR